MNVTVQLDDRSLRDTLKALNKFGKDAERAVKGVVDRTALAVETDAKEKLKADGHIVTGRLRASIHAELQPNKAFPYSINLKKKGAMIVQKFDGALKTPFGDLEAVAGTNVEYGPKIEFEYDSFMRFASENQKEPFMKRMADALNKLIK